MTWKAHGLTFFLFRAIKTVTVTRRDCRKADASCRQATSAKDSAPRKPNLSIRTRASRRISPHAGRPVRKLSEHVARELMIRIVRQEFPEGQPLPHEMELCLEYTASRVVIREAKKHLQALGMVCSRKKFGSFVTPSLQWNYFNHELFDIYMRCGAQTDKSMEDYYALRQFIEPPLAANVARRHSPEFERNLQDLLQEMEQALNPKDRERWLTADLAFHIAFYQESQNILALPLANLMRPMFLRGFALGQGWDANLVKHQELARAVLNHDPEQALHYAHIIVLSGYREYTQLSLPARGGEEERSLPALTAISV